MRLQSLGLVKETLELLSVGVVHRHNHVNLGEAQKVERFDLRAHQPEGEIRLARAVGCDKCRGRGYLGRTALIETLPMTDALRRRVLARASAREILATAAETGFRSMFDDGVGKALAGETTLGEVLRVARSG
jgi:general secretion pathway protein E